jgi:spore maturation protein CgeB
MKIAVLTLSRMGDILLAGPMLDRIQELFPASEIHLIVPTSFVDVGRGLNAECVHALNTDELIVNAAKRPLMIDLYRLIENELSNLLAIKFDRIYNLGYDTISAILSNLLQGQVASGLFFDDEGKRRIAGDWARMAMTSHLARGLNPFHLSDLQLGMAGERDRTVRPVSYRIPEDAQMRMESLLTSLNVSSESTNQLVVMQVGASHPSKRWQAESFGEVARLLHERTGATIVYTGTGNEKELIHTSMQVAGQSAINLAGQTDIPTLAALLRRANLVISNDTGTMHLAQAVGTPVVCLTLGNALSHETGPYGADNLIVEPDIECFPCSFQVHCPHFNCHGHIQPSLVTQLALDMLNHTVPTRYELKAEVRITRTRFDEHGFWATELLHGRKDRFDELRDGYRTLLRNRFNGGSTVEHPTGFTSLNDSTSAQNLLAIANEGVTISNALLNIIETGKGEDQLQLFAQQIDAAQDNVLSQFLHTEELHPLLALFRFELENISGQDPQLQISATGKAFKRLAESVDQLSGSEPSSTNPGVITLKQQNHTRTPEPVISNGDSSSPYARFTRPRFRSERLNILLFENDYYLQGEIRTALQQLGHRVHSIRYLESGNVIEQLLMASLDADLLMTVNHLGFDQDGELASLLEKIKLPYVSWFADRPQYILLDHQVAAGDMAHLFTWERNTINELTDYGFQRVGYLPLATDEQSFAASISPANSLRGPCWVANSMVEPVREWEGRANVRSAHEPLLRMAVEDLLDQRRDPWHALNDAIQQFPVITDNWTHGDKLRMATLIAFRATREDRRRIANAGLSTDLEVVGDDGWKQLVTDVELRDQINYGSDLASYYASSIQLNSTSYQMPTSVNQRVFDVPCAGGVLLTDDQDDLYDLFDVEKECIIYRTPEELVEKIEFIKNHENSVREISELARNRIHSNHTYKQRLQTILGVVREDFKPAFHAERRA